ncbi:HEAT repeat domain-containing protein [Marinimicrobium sp. ABcell2]|uniref:HEAT repeat domain-containing protein n=1 Tax=Marinimicrobium sp. ABcell2 TaxID=3069751 RepID=UPI0027B6FAE9|nr:HEAT repeat domain-containing protein [Marinimicrobium sp. ABcell2]MDQ2078223.1 HEAT repeat domain-containing protein [Marinimicrobium sp. ABcell2]
MIKKTLTGVGASKALCVLMLGLVIGVVGCSRDGETVTKSPERAPGGEAVAGPEAPEVIEISDAEAEKAATDIFNEVRLDLADGLRGELWAADKLLGDPVAINVDNQGRIWAAVTKRSNNSEFDIRGYFDWVPESMSWETVDDRRHFLRTELAPERSDENAERIPDRNKDGSHDWRDLAVVAEEVWMLQDTTGSGRADRSELFLRDFSDEVTDVLGGIYYHNQRDELFLAVAPHAWRVQDTTGDGIADRKEALSDGFGVHIGFSGHGMSGMTLGPDGLIYYSIGDIGFNYVDESGKHHYYPNEGVVVRSEPDGSNFEVFASGVRNTHEFVFDKYGNLITVDNDGDHPGESERLAYLIDGSDSGWRINWQLGKYSDPKNNDYKVWMDENYYTPHFEGQAAHILPPIAPHHSGPTGMVYNPGTALSAEWDDHFFVVTFVGSAARSGINAFTLQPSGASFELAEDKQVLRGVQVTGLDVGPDGALYGADWIEGWGRNERGRIWKFTAEDEDERRAELREETRQLLAADFSDTGAERLAELLGHADMRVRSKAQFELVARGETERLQSVIDQSNQQLARIHALWGLGQMARQNPEVGRQLVPLLGDLDAEVRAQAAKVLGDARYEGAHFELTSLLADPDARPQFFAAQALGRIGAKESVEPLIAMLEANNDEDIYLRQAGAIALSRIGDAKAMAALADHESEAVRTAAVVALLRMQSPLLVNFLQDESEFVVTDAARGITDDVFVKEAIPALAALLNETPFTGEPLLRRVINANLYEGTADAAQRLGTFAANQEAQAEVRAEALDALSVWASSSTFDRVTGRYRGAVQNDLADAQAALQPVYQELLRDPDEQVRASSVAAVGRLGFTEAASTLAEVLERDASAEVRAAALETLQQLGYEEMDRVVHTALNDQSQSVRTTALRMLPDLDFPTDQMVAMHEVLLDTGSVSEQQEAIMSLANINAPEAHAVLAEQLRLLKAGQVAPAVQLEVVTAAQESGAPKLLALVEEYEASKDRSNPMEVFQEALEGGDVESGQRIFFTNNSAQCIRCHLVGDRGSEVGPDLTDIGNLLTREVLLEALVDPAARIAPGYGRITVTLDGGRQVEGFFESETPTTKTLIPGEGEPQTVRKADIVKVEARASGMPPMGHLLTRSQLRDLVEYMTTLTED